MQIGDIVSRNSYSNDIIFKIIAIDNDIAILSGIYVRIIADSNISDLSIVDNNDLNNIINEFNEYKNSLINKFKNKFNHITGKILHYDSDSSYLNNCLELYKELGIYAVGILKNESDIYLNILEDISKYRPDIIVITGHDSFNKKDINDLNNYKNSKNFIKAILKVRSLYTRNDICIYAGACSSYFEALIMAGANYASSINKDNIEAYDPAIVAILASITPIDQIIDITTFPNFSKLKKQSIGGVETYGSMRLLVR